MIHNQISSIKGHLAALVLGGCLSALVPVSASSADGIGEAEKDELKFGFIKLTDMAPLAA